MANSSNNNSDEMQIEIRKLKAEVVKLTGELEQRDKLITSLEHQIRALLTEQSRPGPKSLPDDGVTTPQRRSLEESNASSQNGGDSTSGGGDNESRRIVMESLQPPSRLNVEMQQPLAPPSPKTADEKGQEDKEKTPKTTHIKSVKKANTNTGKTTTETISEDSELAFDFQKSATIQKTTSSSDDSSNSRPSLKSSTTGPGLKSSRGAIKALPRELSIANNDDDDEVTKYSIDDGHPTFEMDKTEMRDAYNARGLYTGTVSKKQQMPHGKGTMEYHLAGRIYQGDWHQGHWHGKGIIRTAEGVYEGEVRNDLKEGSGVYYYHDGRQFKGTFRQDEPVKGTLTFPDKSQYIGELRNGARHGQGTYHFSDGSVYEGESVMDRFEGKGKMTWNDGGWYEGEWSQGEIHGYGMEIRPDGSLRHHGLWRKGVPIRQ